MLSSLFFLILGSLGLYFGSEFLIDGSKNLAKKLKVSDLVIGLTIVSIGTSFPELVVGLISAFQGYTDFVIGNVLGSNIANIGLAIGLPALFFKIDFDLKNSIAPFIYNLLACLMLYVFLQDNLINSKEAQGLLLVFFVYIIASFLRPNITSCNGELENENVYPVYQSVLRIIAGSTILYYGSVLFVDNGAIPLVEQFGLPEKAVGMTIVAIGTSIPELAASLVAIAKKEEGISVGNLIGSNIFNIGSVLGITSIIKPILVDSEIINRDIIWMLIFALIVFVLALIPLKNHLSKYKGFVMFLMYLYFIYIAFVE